MFRTVPLSIIMSFSLYTQQWYMSHRFADSLRAGSGRNHMNCPKHVQFCSKDKFEKFVHLVCFIIRIRHNARSPERQISKYCQLLGLLNPFWYKLLYLLRVFFSKSSIVCVCSVTVYRTCPSVATFVCHGKFC